ncbi:MAG: IclR family transcriptional regulator C-terminal domain-containing protein, partial [Actinomycetota bacterium]
APRERRELVLARPLERLPPLTPTGRVELEAELARIRETGTAVSCGERQRGAGSVAAPVIGVDGYAVGSISVCGPVDRFDEETVERMRPLVRNAACEISGILTGQSVENGGRKEL